MTPFPRLQWSALIDASALAALVWVAAATLHEALGHGLACLATGGDPLSWSTFHFDCDRTQLTVARWRIVSAAGTVVNVGLMAVGLAWWRRSRHAIARLAAWMLVVVNGLTAFGYLLFSAAFGIGDWNAAGVMAGSWHGPGARTALGLIGAGGYYAIIRLGAAMLSRMPDVVTTAEDARRTCMAVWLTTGAVSLFAALAAGTDWPATLGASLGAALGGNAGLLSIARLATPGPGHRGSVMKGGTWLRAAAVLVVVAFVSILGPGVRL